LLGGAAVLGGGIWAYEHHKHKKEEEEEELRLEEAHKREEAEQRKEEEMRRREQERRKQEELKQEVWREEVAHKPEVYYQNVDHVSAVLSWMTSRGVIDPAGRGWRNIITNVITSDLFTGCQPVTERSHRMLSPSATRRMEKLFMLLGLGVKVEFTLVRSGDTSTAHTSATLAKSL
jgi:hypothetical protein